MQDLAKYVREQIERTIRESKANEGSSRFILLEGHDMNIYPLLSVFGKVDYECLIKQYESNRLDPKCILTPLFGSVLALRLSWEGNQAFMSSSYNGDQVGICEESPGSNKSRIERFLDCLKDNELKMTEEEARVKYCHTGVNKMNKVFLFVFVCVSIAFLAMVTYVRSKRG